jgi:dynein heavy chain
VNVGRAIKGEVPLSPELEEVCTSLFNNQVPATWHAKSYPSLKPLASWVVDFLDRLAFMSEWVEGEAPKHWWLPGFFFTQSFLTGAKQNFARKYVLAIDQIDFDFIVISDESKYDLAAGPEDGAYVHGLYTEGARWCAEQEGIAESHPKVLFAPMRSIWILPANVKDIDYGHSYKCPVYKTQARKGTLATTGHSTNFVLYIYLPMQKQHGESHWVKRGLAMLTGLSE